MEKTNKSNKYDGQFSLQETKNMDFLFFPQTSQVLVLFTIAF